MYTCERCGTRFGRPAGVLVNCPRCLARDGEQIALAFRFLGEERAAGPSRVGGLEAAVRRRLDERSPAAGRRLAQGG